MATPVWRENRYKKMQRIKWIAIISLFFSVLLPVLVYAFMHSRIQTLESELQQLQDSMVTVQADVAESKALFAVTANQQTAVVFENIDAETDAESMQGTGNVSGEEDGTEVTQAEDDSVAASGDAVVSEKTARKIYLTFDDGPSSNTGEILDILAEYDVKATFFVIGKQGEWAEELYRRIVDEGHTLGMHSYTHDYSQIYASVDAFSADMCRLQGYLYQVTGVNCKFVRFPGGSSNLVSEVAMQDLITYVNDAGLVYFDWNVSARDAVSGQVTAEEIMESCLDGLNKHQDAVVLMHDTAGKVTTVEALPDLIEAIQAMGDAELLPITEDTVPVQHITIAQEETGE